MRNSEARLLQFDLDMVQLCQPTNVVNALGSCAITCAVRCKSIVVAGESRVFELHTRHAVDVLFVVMYADC